MTIENKYGLILNEHQRKIHKLPETHTFRGHVYIYFGHTYGTYSMAEKAAQKLRDEGVRAMVHTSKDGLHGVYIRRK
jgi:aminopeptidase-like protein